MKLYTFIAVLFLLSFSCTKKDQYSVGQEWNYKTRPTEKSSILKILKIEEYPETGKVIHISISGLKIKNPASPTGYAENLSHIPISEEALNKSVTNLKSETDKKPDSLEMDGYSYWKREFDKGDAGIFTIPVSEIISSMEKSIVAGDYTK
ncbi:hypothetical protein [Chryseobacterium arthrosphaerae]|uniref:Uncharacterized protein n=1 Tax=Chryseobacterium arthrosphaerae TaxID=651561 RepID=A0A1B8ZUQ0_9FLAO|nr:hypothetical protein [Chryseobacterium arthrosphaerae]MDG4654879.1 hypothetical protein [Chryseobacterium arthrosphaerae]OCA75315.1 hypothetical protein BBI00_13680 [Chryseobacterium arthrosphaerae]RTZ49895.1 hypothetical protein EJ377_06995 [Chryseobacterium arthrosphaerae]